jgi:hypothetical protein
MSRDSKSGFAGFNDFSRATGEGRFGRDEIRFGEAIYRCVAHARACSNLYAHGRKADSLLHAARPITDVLPWLETELRAFPQPLSAFTTGISAIGAGVRRNVRPRRLRKVALSLEESADRLVAAIAGDEAESSVYRASVALALLQSAVNAYARAVQTSSLGDYQSARALSWLAAKLLDKAGASESEALRDQLHSLELLLPSLNPPKQLARPEALTEVVEEIFRTAEADLEAIKPGTTSLEEGLKRVERLLEDVVSSYTAGVPALAARLAASLYLRSFEPIKSRLVGVHSSPADRLAEILGIELRRSINDGVAPEQVVKLGREAKKLLVTLRGAPESVARAV